MIKLPHTHGPASPPIVLFGMPCRFTSTILRGLLSNGRRVEAVVLLDRDRPGVNMLYRPEKPRQIPLIQVSDEPRVIPTVVSLCQAYNVMMVGVSANELESLWKRFRFMRTSLSVIACFPRKLPTELLAELPRLPLNIHPSQLPRHRGPEPLFWTFHAGDHETGLSIHAVDHELDTGPIVYARRFRLDLERRHDEVEANLASFTVTPLLSLLDPYFEGEIEPVPQPEEGATWARIPRPEDLVVGSDWNAERVYRFVHGTGTRFGPIVVPRADGSFMKTRDAVTFGLGLAPKSPRTNGSRRVVQFHDGWVMFQPESSSNTGDVVTTVF